MQVQSALIIQPMNSTGCCSPGSHPIAQLWVSEQVNAGLYKIMKECSYSGAGALRGVGYSLHPTTMRSQVVEEPNVLSIIRNHRGASERLILGSIAG